MLEYKTAEEIEEERTKQSYQFKGVFEKYLKELGVKSFNDDRFLLLYKIPTFAKQGVELLKTLMAYNLLLISNKLKLNYIYLVYKEYNAGGKKA